MSPLWMGRRPSGFGTFLAKSGHVLIGESGPEAACSGLICRKVHAYTVPICGTRLTFTEVLSPMPAYWLTYVPKEESPDRGWPLSDLRALIDRVKADPEAAAREGQSHIGYLEALLAAEIEERESRAIARLLHEARLPRMKTLDGFEFDRSGVSAAQFRTLAEGDYIAKAQPILLVGEAGTGKTHLATGLCVAACRQRRRVRFATATALINELAEAAHANQLSRALGRWERLDLICIDELGYVPLAETACELMFQVIADRAEKAAVIITTNLSFSEWSQVIPNPRLCKALIDRLTDQAHIITTGADSYRFRRTVAQRKGGKL